MTSRGAQLGSLPAWPLGESPTGTRRQAGAGGLGRDVARAVDDVASGSLLGGAERSSVDPSGRRRLVGLVRGPELLEERGFLRLDLRAVDEGDEAG